MTTEFIEDIKLDEKIKNTTSEPIKYKVVFLNDDTTPVEWVIKVLIDIFKQYSNDCPGAHQFSETALNIPIHQNLSDDDVNLICDALIAFFQ